MQYLHERIKHMIGILNIKQTEIAKKLGVDKSLITKHLKKERNITIEHLEIYAEILQTSPRELLEGTYEWEAEDYQQFTLFLQKKEQLVKRSSTNFKNSEVKEKQSFRKEDISLDKDNKEEKMKLMNNISSFFAGVAVASASTLAVNAFAKKLKNKNVDT